VADQTPEHGLLSRPRARGSRAGLASGTSRLYSRAKPTKAATAAALQDSLIVQVIDSIEETPTRSEMLGSGGFAALQDLLNAPTPVLAGLIAHLFDVTLQDDIASTTRRLVQMGHDLMNRSRHENAQTSAAP